MQQLELFPELNECIGVEYTDGEDVYVSSPAIEFFEGDQFGCGATCFGCALEMEGVNCYNSSLVVDCAKHPIIWVKKTS